MSHVAAPIRLTAAAERFGLTVGALRAEARRGRLAIYRFAGKDWTTEKDLLEMFEKCRVAQKAPDCMPVTPVSAPASDTPELGSSSTEEPNIALAAALATARALKGRSPPISPKSTKRPGANVLSPKFGSRT